METPIIKYRQYIIIPKKPKMSKGKIASQSCHAAFLALENQRQLVKDTTKSRDDGPCTNYCKWDNIENWKNNGMCVIVLQCKDSLELFGIDKYLEQWNIPHSIYIDEGLTECAPFTPTALATGVLSEDQFWMFENMELFK